jgi:cystathionine beta-lyase family protein involved in aluminum resistance
MNIFERKVYKRILGPVYDNEKENWRILTNKEIVQLLKKTHNNYIVIFINCYIDYVIKIIT